MNKIVSSEYYELRCNNYIGGNSDMVKIKKINTKTHKTLMKTKEVYILDNNIEITIMNLKNAVYSSELRIKIKLDEKRGYEFICHMYKLTDTRMIQEEPIYIGDVDKHSLISHDDTAINICLPDNIDLILEDVYHHRIIISRIPKNYIKEGK